MLKHNTSVNYGLDLGSFTQDTMSDRETNSIIDLVKWK